MNHRCKKIFSIFLLKTTSVLLPVAGARGADAIAMTSMRLFASLTLLCHCRRLLRQLLHHLNSNWGERGTNWARLGRLGQVGREMGKIWMGIQGKVNFCRHATDDLECWVARDPKKLSQGS